ncbi:TetR family transcriptional regulator [Bradyrhizobium macuxiense]|uniref:TetR family transcriptional regulator n=1 Tax=Bradyrhizobium macuxiense TaxID=1755647 RepID=UPI000B211D8D|nr:TetR family transcriptional regulator [Bradyrhizobium macuxiense]
MSNIVERSGVAFGSLYQYFPDKAAIIGTLAERYNSVGRACVRRDLSAVRTVRDVHPALCRVVDSYYDIFMREPVMRNIWQATRADRALQKIDAEDMTFLSGLLSDTIRRIAPGTPPAALTAYSHLIMTLIAATMHHAHHAAPEAGSADAGAVQSHAATRSGQAGLMVRSCCSNTADWSR